MPHTFFRMIHRARTRSQRRRVYGWTLCGLVVVFFILFSLSNQSTFIAFTAQNIPALQIDTGNFREKKHIDPAAPAPPAAVLPDIPSNLGGRQPLDTARHMEIKENEDQKEEDYESDLLPDLAPAIAHFIWCGRKRVFEFRHYMSVKRVNNLIKPDKIMFHYQTVPYIDQELYYDWFELMRTEIDSVVLRPLNASRCDTSGPHRYMLALSLLEQFGGIFVPEDAILVDFPVHLRASPFVAGVVAKTLTEYMDGVIVAKKNGFVSPSSQAGLNVVLASGRSAIQGPIDPCGTIEHFNEETDGHCLCVKIVDEIFPKDIWENESRFGTLARLAAYGTGDLKKLPGKVLSSSSRRTSIPKIGHYICWDCDIKFNTFLSIMSSLHVAGLSKVTFVLK